MSHLKTSRPFKAIRGWSRKSSWHFKTYALKSVYWPLAVFEAVLLSSLLPAPAIESTPLQMASGAITNLWALCCNSPSLVRSTVVVSSPVCIAVVVFCSGVGIFRPDQSALVVFCSTVGFFCPVYASVVVLWSALEVFWLVYAAVVVFCSAIGIFSPITTACSALASQSASVSSPPPTMWARTCVPPPVPPSLHLPPEPMCLCIEERLESALWRAGSVMIPACVPLVWTCVISCSVPCFVSFFSCWLVPDCSQESKLCINTPVFLKFFVWCCP